MAIQIGICTISFSELPVAEALAASGASGARGIELWGREHLPAEASAAEVARVRRLAEVQGLNMAAYGSYAQAGEAEWPDERVAAMLDRVVDLGAPLVRVWAGTRGSAEATPGDWTRVIDSLRAWGDLAGARGLRLVVERHCHTLTDLGDCARRLIDAVGHPAVRLNYQIPYPWPVDAYHTAMESDLRLHLPVSLHAHAQNYRFAGDAMTLVSLAEGVVDYAAWRPLLDDAAFEGWVMLEFLPQLPDADPVALARNELTALREMWGVE